MRRFTVVWDRDAEDELARLWIENPAIRDEITAAADHIENGLAQDPSELGIEVSQRGRQVVSPPLRVLFAISEPDCRVRVLWVKIWYE